MGRNTTKLNIHQIT